MWSSLTNLSHLRTSFRGLFKGMVISVAGAAPQGGMRLATYEYCKEYIQHHNEGEETCDLIPCVAWTTGSEVL